MKSFRLIAAFSLSLLILMSAGVAFAKQGRLYLAGYMGLNVSPQLQYSETSLRSKGDVELGNGHDFAGAIGLRITRNLRMEGEFSSRKADFKNISLNGASEVPAGGELKTTALMLNGYYDFDINWKSIYPFLSLGAGIAWHDGEFEDVSNVSRSASADDMGFIWSVGGGVRREMREGLSYTGSYRYLSGSDVGFDSTLIDYASHEFRIGVQYDLN